MNQSCEEMLIQKQGRVAFLYQVSAFPADFFKAHGNKRSKRRRCRPHKQPKSSFERGSSPQKPPKIKAAPSGLWELKEFEVLWVFKKQEQAHPQSLHSSTEQSIMALAAGWPCWFPEIQNQLWYVLGTELKRGHQNCNLVCSLLGDGGGGVLNPFQTLKAQGKKNQNLDMGDSPRARPLKPPVSGRVELKPMHTASTHSIHSFTHLSEAFYKGGFVLGTGGKIKINQTWKQPSKKQFPSIWRENKNSRPTLQASRVIT